MEEQKELGQAQSHEDQRGDLHESHRHGEHSSVRSLVVEADPKSRVANRSRSCHGRHLGDEWVQQGLDCLCVGRAMVEVWYWWDRGWQTGRMDQLVAKWQQKSSYD